MNTDKQRTQGVVDQVKGKANEIAGAIKGDTSQELKGKGQQLLGKGRKAVADTADDLKNDTDHPVH